MLNPSSRHLVAGPAGPLELALDLPREASAARGIAYIGHPHPLFGGTLDNKVAATLARAYAASGWLAIRPNFRGVGGSAGTHDEGRGETLDLLHLIDTESQWLHPLLPQTLAHPPARALAGFSFGSFVAAQVACQLFERGQALQTLVLAGTAAGKWALPSIPEPIRHRTLLIHGELDETISLTHVLDWARPQHLSILVYPGVDHFFHRRLTHLRDHVVQHIAAHAQTKENPPIPPS
ncbi:MAG TPA: alpha/beta hydrolase [Burkholderiaceae bacterium]|nr:alpha/beta hydrolase [Burkholderiaceae bacterium]